jgi:hypothetical protein
MKKQIFTLMVLISGIVYSQTNTIENGNFENWTTITTTEADNWNSTNEMMIMLNGSQNVTKTNDAYAGNHAVKLTTKSYTIGGTMPGMISNGISFLDGVAFNGNPTSFSGAYKYESISNDTAVIFIEFSANGSTVGANFIEVIGSVNSYTTFNLPISLMSQPDTMVIMCSSGNNVGSALFIDELQINEGYTSLEKTTLVNFKIYPNPVNESLNLDFNEDYNQITIIGIDGNIISTHKLNGHSSKINVSKLQKGVYWIECQTSKGIIKKSFVKK